LIGKTLGKYRIVEQIGRGGMAEVYKAYHPGLNRYVAVKLMHTFLADEEGFVGRFRLEAQSVARLRHPNIVHMYDFDAEGDVTYMVMEFLEGPSLKNRLAELERQGQWLTLEEAARIIRDVGEALAYAHRQGMVHRDVKPANVMLTEDGGAILTDFGIVKMLTASGATQLTASGAMIGTPAYMAPEQSMGAAGDERADIYSLGIVLYQLATGRLPYDADTPMAVVLKHLNAPLPIPSTLNPNLPEGIERIILKALAKDPADRYQSVREMLDHLDQAMRGGVVPEVDPSIAVASQPLTGAQTLAGGDLSTPIPPGRAAVARPAAPPARRPPLWIVGLAGLALVAALAVIGFLALGGGGEEATPTPEPTEVAMATVTITVTATPTGTPQPTDTPDVEATNRAAFVDAIIATQSAPPPTETPTRTPTNTPTPTTTPDQTAAALAACTFDATVEDHLNVYLGRHFAPGTPFEKTWRLLNSGDCDWPGGTALVFISGNQMGAEDSVEVGSVPVGETVDVSVDMRAPNADGSYAATWQLARPTDVPFGEEIPVQINVGHTPTPRPTNTPRPTPTPLATATPTGPLEMSIPSILSGSCWLDPNTGRWGATLVWSAWGGTGNYEYYAEGIGPEFRRDGPSYDFSSQVDHRWPGTLYTKSGDEVVKRDRWVEPSECGY
jgi:tRNA A-37 threonylcarbamoyl transferase component Bud32